MKRAPAPGTEAKTRPTRTASSAFHGRRPRVGAAADGTVRLSRYLSQCGVASRRKADQLIAAGRVEINGRVTAEPGAGVVPGTDRVAVDGRPMAAPGRCRYVLFHKPAGCLCSNGDPFGRPTIYDLLPPQLRTLKYVGRLDADSEGLLLLTDDGSLIERLTHPRFRIERTYLAWVDGPLAFADLRPLERGIEFMGERYRPARVRVVERDGDATLLEFRIAEGRKREVRMMCRAIGRPVLRLLRTGFGPVRLGDLPEGATRALTGDELARLTD